METIRPQTVIGMDSGKKYSWGNAVNAETGEVLKASGPEGLRPGRPPARRASGPEGLRPGGTGS